MSSIEQPLEDAQHSLEQRMAAARENRESVTTEDFPLPGWGSFCWVRLKVIGHKEQRKQVDKNKRIRDKSLLELYVAADTLIAATDGFYEVIPGRGNDDETLKPVQTSYSQLANGVFKTGEEVTPRQAFIRLVGSERVVSFYGQYIEWLNGEREDVGEEQKEDFSTTTS